MAKFLVLFLIPQAVISDWQAKPASEREPAERKMMADWGAWMQKNGAGLSGMEAAGKTKAVTSAGTSDTKNDLMLQCFVEADTHEAAAQLFEGHPHLTIPQSSIQVTEVRPMGQGAG